MPNTQPEPINRRPSNTQPPMVIPRDGNVAPHLVNGPDMIFLMTNTIRRAREMIGGPVRLIDIIEMLDDRNFDESTVFDTLEIMREMGYIHQLPGNELLYDFY